MANWTIIGGSQGPVVNPPGGTTGGGGSSTKDDSLADKATFFAGFGNPILPGVDYGVRHIVSRTSTPGILFAYLASPPAAGSFTFDILLSQDGGSTWSTILNNPISINSANVVQSTDFVTNTAFAPGNLLRLDVLNAGVGPGFANGFQCVLTTQGITVPGWDRATFVFGIATSPPIAQDLGGYFIATRPTAPSAVFLNVKNPPGGDVSLDLQVLRDGAWTSIFPAGGPLTVAAAFSGVLTAEVFASRMAFAPGELIRPYIISGPTASGMGYNVVLIMEVLN
jgi:hypothetical protein